MRQAIANLIEVARLSFNAKGPASPVSPFNPPARCTTGQFQPARLKDQSMFALAKSPLADAADLSPRTTDSILTTFADHEVQRHAATVRAKLLRLVEFAVLRSEIAAAVKTIGTHSNDGLTPAAVVAVLRQRAAELDDLLEDARADRDAHEAARKARMACTEPLRRAVSTKLTSLMAERDNLLIRLDSIRRASTMSSPSAHRYHSLVAAGVTPEQISMLGIASADDQVAGIKARIAVLDAEIAPLREFGTSGDVVHLVGLGLDTLVAQAHPKHAGEKVSA